MALPAAYTEWSLAHYCHQVLGTVAGVLGWDVEEDSYSEIVNDVLISISGDSLADMTSIPQLKEVRALARLAAWSAAVPALAGLYDFSADGGSYSRSQAMVNAQAALTQAQIDSYPYQNEYKAQVDAVTYHLDPYQDYDDGLYSE